MGCYIIFWQLVSLLILDRSASNLLPFFSLGFPFVLNRKSYTTTVINFGILGICWLPRGKIGEKSTSIEQFLKTRMQWVLTAEALGFFFFFLVVTKKFKLYKI